MLKRVECVSSQETEEIKEMINIHHNVASIRQLFLELKEKKEYVIDKTGCSMLEILGATFIADETSIFGIVNQDYVQREIEWYKSMSLRVHDIPGGAPSAWLACASPEGFVNSNYGYLVWSDANFRQYEHVLNELRNKPESRRAQMIYTRPSMWGEFDKGGMSDFICTNAVQYAIRDGKLVAIVQMRSNDVLFGYKNDKAWQDYVHNQLASDLSIPVGDMIWHAGSLHVYEKHFHLIK